jgi:hypothetical protein
LVKGAVPLCYNDYEPLPPTLCLEVGDFSVNMLKNNPFIMGDYEFLHVYGRWHFTGNAKKKLDFLPLVPSVMISSEPSTSVHEIEMTKAEKRKKYLQVDNINCNRYYYS